VGDVSFATFTSISTTITIVNVCSVIQQILHCSNLRSMSIYDDGDDADVLLENSEWKFPLRLQIGMNSIR
jgi:hypothetical protein